MAVMKPLQLTQCADFGMFEMITHILIITFFWGVLALAVYSVILTLKGR